MNRAATRERIMELGAEIRRQRKDQGLSQDKLAKMISTDQAHIHRIEKGQHNPSIAMYIAIDMELRDLITF